MTAAGIGSVCSGYGGLDIAVERVFQEQVKWFYEYESAPSKVLAHHWPDVPNHGDLTTAAWPELEPVRVMCGGTPCQDLSGAGKRKGMTDGTRSNLWVQMREGIATLRPEFVVWENVRGAYSARADSDVEREPGLLGELGDGPALRALGRVLGDLSSLGYDARWAGIRASEVGAPHNRYRVFVVAQDANRPAGDQWRFPASGQEESGRSWPDAGGRGGAPIADSGSDGLRGHEERDGSSVESRLGAPFGDDPDGRARAAAGDADDAGLEGRRVSAERPGERLAGSDGVGADAWGRFGPAVHRWEGVLGRIAPPATKPDGKGGNHRLSPEFVEWMMGLELGHVTDPAIGLTRTEQLKALGNGVVIQQAEFAIRYLLGLESHRSETTEGES